MKIFLKKFFPFIPLILVSIILILEPYYLFSAGGDTNFHLVRAREILENPTYGIFWNYLVYHPLGRPLWHPPLFHTVYAFLWSIGGIRFAHSFMCVFQILLTTFVASWVAKNEYGNISGFFAGFLALVPPLSAPLVVAIPGAYIPILAVLTIYFIHKNKKITFLTSLAALWMHMVSVFFIIPLFLVDDYKNKFNRLIIALLFPFFAFWATYWIYFKDRLVTGGLFYTINNLYWSTPLNLQGLYNLVLVFSLGIIGLYLIYKLDYRKFKLYSTYIILVTIVSFFGFGGDFLRGFQFVALPLAILAGLTIKTVYNYLFISYNHFFSNIFILIILLMSVIGFSIFVSEWSINEYGWESIDIPFEEKDYNLKIFIENKTLENEIIWAEPALTEKIAWMTGRKVSNGLYQGEVYGATKGFIPKHQNINIYLINQTFIINNANNYTLYKINQSI